MVDRTPQFINSVDFCYSVKKRGISIFARANNNYQGHSPATIAKLLELRNTKNAEE